MTPGLRRTKPGSIPRIAVIGCGAAAREFCLPALARYRDFRRSVILVDNCESHVRRLSEQLGIQYYCTDYRELPFGVDAAVVMTPHYLHAEQSIHFLRQGKPVLVEKPIGMTSGEVAAMLQAASSTGTLLMVNNCRRLFPSNRQVGRWLHSGKYGRILRIKVSDGSPFEWDSVSSFYLRNAAAAKGVLLDRGAHTIDVVCTWLPGRPQVVEAQHDATGGVEALMKVRLKSSDVSVDLTFSRLYKLDNCYTIECEKAEICGRLFQSGTFELIREGRSELIRAGKSLPYQQYAWQLLDNFIEVVQNAASPLFTADDVAPSIGVIEEAYQRATPLDPPWYADDPNLAWLRNRTINCSF